MTVHGTKPLGWGISQGEPDDSFREYSRQDQDMALTAANEAYATFRSCPKPRNSVSI